MSSAIANLFGLDRAQLEELVAQLGGRSFRARQVMRWAYHQEVLDFAEMTDLAKQFRAQLASIAEFALPEVVSRQESADGTIK